MHVLPYGTSSLKILAVPGSNPSFPARGYPYRAITFVSSPAVALTESATSAVPQGAVMQPVTACCIAGAGCFKPQGEWRVGATAGERVMA